MEKEGRKKKVIGEYAIRNIYSSAYEIFKFSMVKRGLRDRM